MGDAVDKYLKFEYDYRGFGDLILANGGDTVDNLLCRTGSIRTDGALQNAIKPGTWYLKDLPVDTSEPGMSVHVATDGWKCRLFRKKGNGYERTRYLIHPDGGLPGTLGCIGIQGTNAQSFRFELDNAIKEMKIVPVEIKKTGET